MECRCSARSKIVNARLFTWPMPDCCVARFIACAGWAYIYIIHACLGSNRPVITNCEISSVTISCGTVVYQCLGRLSCLGRGCF